MMKQPLWQALMVAIPVILLDQATKFWLVDLLEGKPSIIVTSFFNLVMVWNRGISFGLFSGLDARLVLIVMKLLVIVVLVVWLYKERSARLIFPLGLVIGGATGNLADRLRWGAVADFFDVHVAGYHWPAFNVADSAIVVGVFLLLWASFKTKPSPPA